MTYIMENTQEKESALPLFSLYFSSRLQEGGLQLALTFCFWDDPWLNVTCDFLLYMLDFLIGKAPSVFTMENELLRPPDNGENEMSASCFTVYKAFQVGYFMSSLQ